MLALIAEKRTKLEADLVTIRQSLSQVDAERARLEATRLQLLEAGIRLEGRIAQLDDLTQETVPVVPNIEH